MQACEPTCIAKTRYFDCLWSRPAASCGLMSPLIAIRATAVHGGFQDTVSTIGTNEMEARSRLTVPLNDWPQWITTRFPDALTRLVQVRRAATFGYTFA